MYENTEHMMGNEKQPVESVAEANVLQAIPHRPPFLFVDRVVQITPTSIKTERRLRPDEEFFKGHYPNQPIMPGVLLCEAVFQSAGILMSQQIMKPDELDDRVPVLVRVESAKFKRMALPGDCLQLSATFDHRIQDFFFFDGCVHKDGQLLVSIRFILGIVSEVAHG